jgi:hypothetical protein
MFHSLGAPHFTLPRVVYPLADGRPLPNDRDIF